MEQNKTYVYVFELEFNSEEENDDCVKVYKDRNKAIQAWKNYVKDEEKSDFVMGNPDYELFANFVFDEEEDDVDGTVALYYFGSDDDRYFTKVKLSKAEVIE